MSKPNPRSLWLLLLWVLHLGAAPSLQPSPTTDPAVLPAAPPNAPAELHLPPYLQAVGQTTATLRFETAGPLAVQVSLSDVAGQELATLPDGAVRLHAVRAEGLAPGTVYRYRLRAPGGATLADGELKTWPADLSTIRFFAYGDTRTRPDVHRAICDAMARAADGHLFVLHSGDLVADGREWRQWRAQFFEPGARLFAKLPVLPVPGNHERGSELYRAYFSLPEPEWYWGLTVGPLHLTALDLERDLRLKDQWPESPQGRWLLADLAAAESVPWRLAMFHCPIWSSGPHGAVKADGQPGEAAMRFAQQALFGLLVKHGYRLTINGHDHLYERSEHQGLTMVTAGGGGAPIYKVGKTSQNPYSQRVVSAPHWCDLTVSATTLSCRVVGVDGQEIDRFELRR